MAVEIRDSSVGITADQIRLRTSDEAIFRYYCSAFKKEGEKFSSELREDPVPSSVISFRYGKFRYFDFGYPDHKFDSIGYVQYKYGLGYTDTLQMIDSDMNLGLGKGNLISKEQIEQIKQQPRPERAKTMIQIKSRTWNRSDIEFWSMYGITLASLKEYHVVPISHYWINGRRFLAEKLAYAYIEHAPHIKIYQPLSDRKWFSNTPSSAIQGLSLLPIMGKRVVLTSSLKDVLVMDFFKVPAVALQSEMMLPHPKLIALLKRKFEIVDVLYDNDFDKESNPGQTMAKKICAEYGLRNILIPEVLRTKDISDTFLVHGPVTVFNIINHVQQID